MTEPFGTDEGQGVRTEEIKVKGSELVDQIKDLLHQANIRRIVIKHDGESVLELPLTLAAVGVVLAPVLAAVGAFAALVTDCSIVVERIVDKPEAPSSTSGPSETTTL